MDGNKRDHFRKRPSNQFKRKGVSKKAKGGNWSHHEQSSGNSHSDDTVYRILCPSRKIGGVIGKGGGIIKALRDETRAKITIAELVPGSDERVILIHSSPLGISKKQGSDENEQMMPQCAAQDALLKVHDRILEEDLLGGKMASDDGNGNTTIRLLVPDNLVGCLLGKGGDVITRLRTETGASIRVLPAEHLPPCANRSDELVQICGEQKVAKRALYKVSSLLHQNPRKDKPPSVYKTSHGRSHFPTPRGLIPNIPPPENPMWAHQNSTSHPAPWMEGHGTHASRFGPGGFDRAPPEQAGDVSAQFSMKILCSAGKISGVIGKGGFYIKQLQQETGSTIHVEDASTDSEERVICISAFEASWNQRSQTIDTILELMNKTSEFSEKGTISTRLLVPSSKVGCILGQGGHVINEMRKRTQADIKVYAKDDKPKCAAEDEELVQISGNFGFAKDALAEISMRLRERTMRDANANGPAPRSFSGPPQSFGPSGSFPAGGPPPAGRSGAYELLRGGGLEFEHRIYHVPPAAGVLEAKIPYNPIGSHVGTGSRIPQFNEEPVCRVNFLDIQPGRSERVIDIHGSAERLSAPQNFPQSFTTPSRQNVNPEAGSYQRMNANPHPGPHQNINARQNPYQNINTQQNPYDNLNIQQNLYQSINARQSPYSVSTQQNPYENINGQQNPYQSINAQQSPYPVSTQQNLYPDTSRQQGGYNPAGMNASQNAYHSFSTAQQSAYQPRL